MHKAHEKIWLQVDPDGESCDPEQYDLADDCTWCKEQINENDVAYIRADLVESLRQQLSNAISRKEAAIDMQESLRQQIAAALAAIYSLLMIFDFSWKKFVRDWFVRFGLVKPLERRKSDRRPKDAKP